MLTGRNSLLSHRRVNAFIIDDLSTARRTIRKLLTAPMLRTL
jgi:hypothetical protein